MRFASLDHTASCAILSGRLSMCWLVVLHDDQLSLSLYCLHGFKCSSRWALWHIRRCFVHSASALEIVISFVQTTRHAISEAKLPTTPTVIKTRFCVKPPTSMMQETPSLAGYLTGPPGVNLDRRTSTATLSVKEWHSYFRSFRKRKSLDFTAVLFALSVNIFKMYSAWRRPILHVSLL